MTDRGLPIVDGAPACPFVAFDDDREERASGPDTRHRCYAEVRPAPRAMAHQDAYCLSSAFALCPTFQDWARRESARPRDASPAERLPAERLPAERLPAERLSAEALLGEVLPTEEPPRRNPQRSWTAPPPWVGSPGEDPTLPSGQAEHRAGAPEFLAPQRRTEAGLAGSLAHQIAMDALPQPALPSDAGRYAPPGSPARGAYSGLPSRTDQGDDDGQDDEAFDRERERERAVIPRPPARPGGLARVGAMLTGRGRPTVGNTRPRRRSGEPATPSWERPHRYEAYPTLRTRIGIPAIPRLAFLAVALVLSMLGLFMLPGLLGLGSPQGSPSPVPSPSRSAAPSGSPGPSIVPVPTAQTYVVEPGDTFSKIAARFGVALADLVAANKDQYPNPDRIVVGDTVIIPAPLPSGFTNASPAATAAPTPKASPTRAPTRTPTKAPTRAPTKAP